MERWAAVSVSVAGECPPCAGRGPVGLPLWLTDKTNGSNKPQNSPCRHWD